MSKGRLKSIIKEEVQKYLQEQDGQKEEIRELLQRAIMQIEEGHVELIQDAALVLSNKDVNPKALERILKVQAQYIEELKQLQEALR